MAFLTVESGSVSVAGKRYGPGIHELDSGTAEDVRKSVDVLNSEGVEHVMVTNERPEHANVHQSRVEAQRAANPAGQALTTAQQVNQAQYEALQAKLAKDLEDHGDVSSNVALAEQDMAALDRRAGYRAMAEGGGLKNVITTEDLKAGAAERAKERGVGAHTATAGELAAAEGLPKAPQEQSASEKSQPPVQAYADSEADQPDFVEGQVKEKAKEQQEATDKAQKAAEDQVKQAEKNDKPNRGRGRQ